MARGKVAYMNEIFRLLSEQHELLERWPYSSEQIRKDKEISALIRKLVDQICLEQSTAKAMRLAKIHFEKPVSLKP